MDLCSCICHFPKSFCSSSKISSSLLGSLHCKSFSPRWRPEGSPNRFPFNSLRWRHRDTIVYSRRQEDDNFEDDDNQEEVSDEEKVTGIGKLLGLVIPIPGQEKENNEENLGIIAACFVGLLTGIGVVLFNNTVHEIRDIFWGGTPSLGASWLRGEPLQDTWKQVIFVPVCGGIIVSVLNTFRASLESDMSVPPGFSLSNVTPYFVEIDASQRPTVAEVLAELKEAYIIQLAFLASIGYAH